MSEIVDQAVKFDLPGPDYEDVTWLHNEHGAASSSPLSRTVGGGMMGPEKNEGLPERIHVNSFAYSRSDEWPPSSTLPGHLRDVDLPKDDSNLLDWQTRCLPLVEEVVSEIAAFDPDTVSDGDWKSVIDEHQKRIGEAMRLVHSSAVFEAQMFSETFVAQYIREFGPARQAEGLALLQGFPNVSTDRAASLWDLGRISRQSPSVMTALESGVLPSGESQHEVEFRSGFKSAMDTYGHMNPLMMEDMPTWIEDVRVPLAIIRQYSTEGDDRSPRKLEQASRSRRIKLESQLVNSASTSKAVVELLNLLPYAQHIGAVTEDHNLLADQKVGNASRQRWLKVGHMLSQRGKLKDLNDVFYYEYCELLQLLENGMTLSALEIATRRDQLELWRTVIPPAVLGKGAVVKEKAVPGTVVTGMAAAAGTYTGRARVITVVTEAKSLEEGDVLVCDLTTPSWTPYFAVIGAVVTNIGSILAHGAIVAREFGIPAVVATGDGTVKIPDGATVRVDGAAGTVTVVSI
ncbi:MAG: PEP-utilizing enzyme [Dehalococcoidia bacterium]